MSTNWFYRCMSHEPNISSEYLFTYPDPLIKDLHRREGIVAIPDWVMENVDTQWDAKGWHWLRQHATCTVGIFNEYGESLAYWEAAQEEMNTWRASRAAAGLCVLRMGTGVKGIYRHCDLPANHKGIDHEWRD